MAFTGSDECLLFTGFCEGEPGRRLQLLDSEPAVPEGEVGITQDDAALFIRVEHAQVVVFACICIVAGVPDLYGHIFERILGNFVQFDDLDGRPLIIFKIYIPVTVGEKGHQLGFLRQQVRLRHGFFDDLHHSGQQILYDRDAIFVRFYLGNGVTIRTFHEVDRVRNWNAGVRVRFVDIQIGPPVIGQGDRAGLPGEQLHMMLCIVWNVIWHRGQFTHGIDTWLQIGYQDLACGTGGAVQIVRAVLDLRNAEGHPGQAGAIATQFD